MMPGLGVEGFWAEEVLLFSPVVHLSVSRMEQRQ
jgi:hypothetical protein